MNKEELLSMLKAQVVMIRDRSAEFQKDPRLLQDWSAKTQFLQKALDSMNSCDALWLNDEYMKWFNKEVKPSVDKIDPSLFRQLHS